MEYDSTFDDFMQMITQFGRVMAGGGSAVILMPPPSLFVSLLKHLLQVQGGGAITLAASWAWTILEQDGPNHLGL